jgi:Trk-type K+ transport system membrane component
LAYLLLRRDRGLVGRRYGVKVPAVRAIMVAGMFTGGVGFYVYYALQPHLLNLWGNQQAYGIAGLAAAFVAPAQLRR